MPLLPINARSTVLRALREDALDDARQAGRSLAVAVSMASSRLPARMFQRALELNSRESDSPRLATSAMGSRPGRTARAMLGERHFP